VTTSQAAALPRRTTIPVRSTGSICRARRSARRVCSTGRESGAELPAWYNAHNLNEQLFPIVTNSPRVVTNSVTYQNVNRASRNLLEAMAAQARAEGIYVFTLGYGPYLTSGTGQDNEPGSDILKCMANVPGALKRCYNPKQPVGVYCYAATPADLKPCYAQLASQILRISK
jgi:hypothetical protein